MVLRGRNIALLLILLATLAAVANFYMHGSWISKPAKFTILPDSHPEPCPNRLDLPKDFTITFPVQYARRDIIVKQNPKMIRESVTLIDAPLFPEQQIIDLISNPQEELQNCFEPLLLDVPLSSHEPADASHIILGMATLLDRLEQTVVDLQRWLSHTNAHLFVIAMAPDETDPDPATMAETESKMRDLGMRVTIVNRLDENDGMSQRYFSLVKIMYEHRQPETKWMAIIDDDTFFPSMHNLMGILGSFNSEEEWYIGAMSEEWWAVVRYGLMGFGGAGIFLSMPLAAVLNANYDDCRTRSGASAGDMRIRECIIWHTNTKLTHVPGLHQIDMLGDRSGLYESGRLPLSLHHWKTGWWDEGGHGAEFPMAAMHLIADVCGDCFLERWQFDGDLILSNGYSIAQYPTGAWTKLRSESHLDRPENTWNEAGVVEGSNNAGWDHYLGPLRPKLELEEEKIQYRFLHAVAVDGGVRQFYFHSGVSGDLDTLLELLWMGKEVFDTSINETIAPGV